MPIEFPCQQCGQTLRVPDDAAGKMARCPKCSYVSRAPGAPAAPATPGTPPFSTSPPPSDPYATGGTATGPSAADNPFAGGANPFRDQPVTTPPGAVNPYQAPTMSGVPGEYTQQVIRNKVRGPAIGLIVVGALNLLWLALFAVVFAIGVAEGEMDDDMLGLVILIPILLLKSVAVIYGGLQMMKLRNYAAAIMAVVISFLPCCYCYVFELPIAIWAVVVLSDHHVRAAFK